MNLFDCSLFEDAFRSEMFVTDESDLEVESIRMDRMLDSNEGMNAIFEERLVLSV